MTEVIGTFGLRHRYQRSRLIQRCLGLFHRHFVVPRIEFHQQLAGLHFLVVLNINALMVPAIRLVTA